MAKFLQRNVLVRFCAAHHVAGQRHRRRAQRMYPIQDTNTGLVQFVGCLRQEKLQLVLIRTTPSAGESFRVR